MSPYEGRFAGRSAVLTGGASGLAREAARRIVQEGGRVCLWDIDQASLQEAQRAFDVAHVVAVDVTDHEAVRQAAAESHAALGAIDILVTSAGVTGATAPVHEFPVESWRRTIDVNLNGLFYCKEGNPNASAYSASKAAVLGFTKSLGKELAGTGVLANAITPATFESPILEQLPASQIEYMRSRIPMGRLGEAYESAAMICFMASEECSFTTGATFDTSGGRTTY